MAVPPASTISAHHDPPENHSLLCGLSAVGGHPACDRVMLWQVQAQIGAGERGQLLVGGPNLI